jgi:glutathione S-transferase
VHAWHERMVSRPAWKKVMAKRVECMAEQGLQPNGMPIGINSMEEFQEMMKKQAKKAE